MTAIQTEPLPEYSHTWEVRTAPLTQVQLLNMFENIVGVFQSKGWDNIVLTYEGRMETDHNAQPELKMKRLTLVGLSDFFKHEIQSGHIVLGGYELFINSEGNDTGFTFTREHDALIWTSDERLINDVRADWDAKGFSPSHAVIQTWYRLPSGGHFFMN